MFSFYCKINERKPAVMNNTITIPAQQSPQTLRSWNQNYGGRLWSQSRSRSHTTLLGNTKLIFMTICFHIGLPVHCALLTSNFFKFHTCIPSLVSVPSVTVHQRTKDMECHYESFCCSNSL